MVTEENLDRLPEGALEEWNVALDEYDGLTSGSFTDTELGLALTVKRLLGLG